MDTKVLEGLAVGTVLNNILEFRQMTTNDLAKLSKYSQKDFDKVIDGQKRMSKDMANELERLLFVEPDFWNKFI